MTRSTIALSSYFRFANKHIGAVLVLQDVQRVHAQFLADELQHTGAAETALAAAHAGTGPALDAVDGGGGHFAVEGCQDLALGDGLAAADDPAVSGLLLHEFGLFLSGQLLEADVAAAILVIGFFGTQSAVPFQDAHSFLGHGGGGGQAGGLHASQGDPAVAEEALRQ